MTYTEYVGVELNTIDHPDSMEIEVQVECSVENDGIGFYEYGSERAFDKGRDYVVIEGWTWDKTGFSKEEIAIIDEEIEKASENWSFDLPESDFDDREPDYYND